MDEPSYAHGNPLKSIEDQQDWIKCLESILLFLVHNTKQASTSMPQMTMMVMVGCGAHSSFSISGHNETTN